MNILSSGEECSIFMFQLCFGESAVIYISLLGSVLSHLGVCSCVAHVLPPADKPVCACLVMSYLLYISQCFIFSCSCAGSCLE